MWYNNRNAAIVRLDRLIQRRKFGKGAISILRIWYNHTMCGENLTTKTVLQDLPGPLLAWYRANARDLPWRRTTDPYQIWVSEIMLQQTRVAAVLGYYARFLETFPTVEALAACAPPLLGIVVNGIVSGRFDADKEVYHVQGGKKLRLSRPQQLMAAEREIIEEGFRALKEDEAK